MTKQVQRRRGTATQHTSFTGAEGEISVNTTNKSAHVHDGVTAGGFELARKDLDNVTTSSVASKVSGGTISTIDINGGTIDGAVIGGSSAAAITGTTITGTSFVTSGDMTFGDNDKAIFGAGSDLQIYHDGSASIITESGAGNLKIQGSNIEFVSATGEDYASFLANGAARFHYDNALKLATTSTGVDVTGTVTADGLTLDFGQNLTVGGTTYPFSISKSAAGNLPVTFKDTNDAAAASVSFIMRAGSANERTALKIDGNNDISFYEDTGTTPKFFWDASAEALGIGTTSPAELIHIAGGASAAYLKATNSAGTQGIEVGVSSTGDGVVNVQDAKALRLFTTDTERMRIDSSGNVGIGTSSPSRTLSVNGIAGFGNGTIETIISFSDRGILGTQSNHALELRTNGAERMRIDASGNVGIGTAAPGAKLEVTGETRIYPSSGTANLRFGSGGVEKGKLAVDASSNMTFETAGSERARITSTGNVGIGTSSPLGKLDVQGGNLFVRHSTAPDVIVRQTSGTITSGTSLGRLVYQGTNAAGTYAFASVEAEVDGATEANDAPGRLLFKTTSDGSNTLTERMRITSSGNVGIGTSSPNAASIIDAQSTTKGVRFPNMTTTQKNAMANVAGNVIFDTTLGKLCVNTGSGWQTITSV